jgi:predicted phosphoadenosine phosphosulfate sulfurtransferase
MDFSYRNTIEVYVKYATSSQGEAVVKPDAVADDLGRKAVTVVRICTHLTILLQPRS